MKTKKQKQKKTKKKLKPHIKTDKIIIKCDDANFINIKPILINDTDVNNMAVSKKFPFGKQDFKYFISYKNNKLLCIFFPEMSKYKRYSDKIRCINFMINDLEKVDKLMTIREKNDNMIKRKYY